MKEDFISHNLFWKGLDQFEKFDPHLSRLAGIPYIHKSYLEEKIPVLTPGVYVLTGSRQVGKTTLLKLIMKDMLKDKALAPEQIYYLPCDTIRDFKQLYFEIDQFRLSKDPSKPFALFVDEVTYVEGWERAIKAMADEGFFKNGSAIVTGSDSVILKEAMMMLPGRRGDAGEQDFHLHPLSFREYVSLKDKTFDPLPRETFLNFENELNLTLPELNASDLKKLKDLFGDYLITGGFMPAINDLAKNGMIQTATYKTYLQWIIGDMLKRGKQEHYLREIISALISRLGKQITWHNLAGAISIDHHQTVADYVNLLSRMDAGVIVPALCEHTLSASPKKARKIFFSDPFIFHVLFAWIKGKSDPFPLSKELMSGESELKDALLEGTVTSLFCRAHNTFYIKADGEVDIAITKGTRFLPIEIKNSTSLRKNDLKQILKYKRGIIGYADDETGKFDQLDVIPMPLLAFLATE